MCKGNRGKGLTVHAWHLTDGKQHSGYSTDERLHRLAKRHYDKPDPPLRSIKRSSSRT
jgi:ribonuclease HII